MLLSRQHTWTGHVVRMNASFDRQSEMLEDSTYATWIAQSDTSTPPISTRGTAWRTAVKKGAAKAETKRATDAEIKWQRRHKRALALENRTNHQPEFACRYCGRNLTARIDQLSRERACARKRWTICDVNVLLETEKTADDDGEHYSDTLLRKPQFGHISATHTKYTYFEANMNYFCDKIKRLHHLRQFSPWKLAQTLANILLAAHTCNHTTGRTHLQPYYRPHTLATILPAAHTCNHTTGRTHLQPHNRAHTLANMLPAVHTCNHTTGRTHLQPYYRRGHIKK